MKGKEEKVRVKPLHNNDFKKGERGIGPAYIAGQYQFSTRKCKQARHSDDNNKNRKLTSSRMRIAQAVSTATADAKKLQHCSISMPTANRTDSSSTHSMLS